MNAVFFCLKRGKRLGDTLRGGNEGSEPSRKAQYRAISGEKLLPIDGAGIYKL